VHGILDEGKSIDDIKKELKGIMSRLVSSPLVTGHTVTNES
jgi:hypothetical protein